MENSSISQPDEYEVVVSKFSRNYNVKNNAHQKTFKVSIYCSKFDKLDIKPMGCGVLEKICSFRAYKNNNSPYANESHFRWKKYVFPTKDFSD